MSDYLAERKLDNTLHAWVIPLTYGRARIAIGPPGELWFKDAW